MAGITPAVVRRMVDLGCDPGDLVACICPSAGPCCYEVGEEVRAAALQGIGPHATSFFRLAEPAEQRRGTSDTAVCRAERLHFDLWRANACALARAGLRGRSHPCGRDLHDVSQRPVPQPPARRRRRRAICGGDRLGLTRTGRERRSGRAGNVVTIRNR